MNVVSEDIQLVWIAEKGHELEMEAMHFAQVSSFIIESKEVFARDIIKYGLIKLQNFIKIPEESFEGQRTVGCVKNKINPG